MSKAESQRVVASNRKARHEYEVLETIEAGLELKGPEVKS
ncbi:MAG: SsrA-binding protein, partial [Longimicrobiales bacterium]